MEFDIDLLRRFYREDCTEEESKEVLGWFIDPSQKQSVVSAIELYWYKFEANETDKQRTIQSIKEKINSKIVTTPIVKEKPFKIGKPIVWRSAAVISVIFVFTYLLWDQTRSNSDSQPTDGNISTNYVVKATEKGKKLQTQLSDGSMVFLNSESKISFSNEHFNDKIRLVYLEGEAYFQVAKNDSVPFVVSTRNVSITALGTSFNIRTYTEDNKAYIALETGKVSIRKNGPASDQELPILLSPGEIAEFDKFTEMISPYGKFVWEEHLAWKNGLLFFSECNLSEVIKKLERWYGVEVVLLNQDNYDSWNYSGRFNNVSLEKVLEGIGYTKSFEFEINGKTVYIKFKS